MQAHDRYLPDWFARIRGRQLTLPRFQRHQAWEPGQVSSLVTTVLRGLPAGAALILEVGDEEKFESRTMIGAPEDGAKVNEQLLDGQQRLTALWRSLTDHYPDSTFLVGFEDDPHEPGKELPFANRQARWITNGSLYPKWVDSPAECWERGFVPLGLLAPDAPSDGTDLWIDAAIPAAMSSDEKLVEIRRVSKRIRELQTRIREFNLPYLSLPASTTRGVALDVFVKMNTSSVRLSTYDIVVALVEDATGKSLHDHVTELLEKVPRVAEYADVPGLVLDVVALRQNRSPSQAGISGIDFKKMISNWDTTVESIRGMVEFLEEQSIYDDQRLPTYTALPVIAALWSDLPTQPDAVGNARHLLTKYVWHAFLTTRYEQASASGSLSDFRALRDVLQGKGDESAVPIFDEEAFPLPGLDAVIRAEWPRRKSIGSRGILALQMRAGAEDLADGKRASVATITSKDHPREYHHLFPRATLEEAGVAEDMIYRALNCALITWRTNRVISNKDPVAYLRERAEASTLGEPELRRRLATHLVPYEELAVGYSGMSEQARADKVKADYQTFLKARAQMIVTAARQAADGQPS